MRQSQGILPCVSDGRQPAVPPPHVLSSSQSKGRFSPNANNDGTHNPTSQHTPASTEGGTALLPAVPSGPTRSPSPRTTQIPAQHLALLVARHHPPTPPTPAQLLSSDTPAPVSSSGRFHNTTSTGSDSGTPGGGNSIALCEVATSSAPSPSAIVTPSPVGANVAVDAAPLNLSLMMTDDWLPPPLPSPPPLPIVSPLAVSPPVVTSGGRGRCSLTNMAMVGHFGRPGGAWRNLGPTTSDQPPSCIARSSTKCGGSGTLSHSTSTVTPYNRAATVLETPGSPGTPMQPRPPVQVPALPYLDDPSSPAAATPHSGAILSPRVIRTQLMAAGPPLLQSLGNSLLLLSGRQGCDLEDPLEHSSVADKRLDEQQPSVVQMEAAATSPKATEGPPVVVTSGISSGSDSKQMQLITELAVAVAELQHRVADMTPRLPQDPAAASDAGSGYSWCTSNRSSAHGYVSGMESSSLSCALSGGPWSTPGYCTSYNGGVLPTTAIHDRTTDERLAVLEQHMKQLVTVVSGANSVTPPLVHPVVRVSASGGDVSQICLSSGGGDRTIVGPEQVVPLQFRPKLGAREAMDSTGGVMPAAPAGMNITSAAMLGLALGLAMAVSMRRHPGGGGTATETPQKTPAKLLPLPLPAILSTRPPSALSDPVLRVRCRATQTAVVAEASAAAIRCIAQRVGVLEERIKVLEHCTAAAAAPSTYVTAVQGDTVDAQVAPILGEALQGPPQAVVEEAVTSTLQTAPAQVEARVKACEQQFQQQYERLRELQQHLMTVMEKLKEMAGGRTVDVNASTDSSIVNHGSEVHAVTAEPTCGCVSDSDVGTGPQSRKRGLTEGQRNLEGYPLEQMQLQLWPRELGVTPGSSTTAGAPVAVAGAVDAKQPEPGWCQPLEALMKLVRDVDLQATSACAQSSSCAAEIQAVLEQASAAQATAAAAAASARNASAMAASAERTAVAALNVVDMAATSKRVNNVCGNRDIATRRSRSSGGVGAAAASAILSIGSSSGVTAAKTFGCVGGGGLQSPLRSEIWLDDLPWDTEHPYHHFSAKFAAAAADPVPLLTDMQQQQQQQQRYGEHQVDSKRIYEAWRELPPADGPPSPPLSTRRLAARDLAFHIHSDGADVVIGGGGGSAATPYGVSISRTNALDGALTRLAAAEASLRELHAEVSRALAQRVTKDELRESMAQVDLKIRAVECVGASMAAMTSATAGSGGVSFFRRASVGLHAAPSFTRLASHDGGMEAEGLSGDGGASMAAAAARATPSVVAVRYAAVQGTEKRAQGNRCSTAGAGEAGGVSDSVSSRAAGGVGGDVHGTLTHLQRSLCLVEQRLEVVEVALSASTSAGERLTALTTAYQQLQRQQLQLQQQQLQLQQHLQLQLPAPSQDRASTAPPQVQSRSGSVVRRYGSGVGGAVGSVLLLGDDEGVMQPASRVAVNEGELGRQMRHLAEQVVALTGQWQGQGQARVRS